jgi:hypothetical protein
MSGIERPDTKPFHAHYSTSTSTPKSRIQLIEGKHAKNTGNTVKKARKDGSARMSGADTDITMHDAGAHTDSIPRSVAWAVLNFSFTRFAPGH